MVSQQNMFCLAITMMKRVLACTGLFAVAAVIYIQTSHMMAQTTSAMSVESQQFKPGAGLQK